MRRMAALAACLALAACGTGSGEATISPKDIDAIAEETSLGAREFEATIAIFGQTVRIAGVVQDAYRYAATVYTDGRPTFEEVVVDDARYLRLIDTDGFAAHLPRAPGTDVLASGAWVVDRRGAPPEFGTQIAPNLTVLPGVSRAAVLATLLDPATLLREVRYLDRLPIVLRTGRSLATWNPDAASYLPAEDKFPPHEEDGTRFDALPKPFDPSITVTSIDVLEPYFQTSAVWARDRRITRIERLFELPDLGEPQYRQLREQIGKLASGGAASEGAPEAERRRSQAVADAVAAGGMRATETRVYREPAGTVDVRAPEDATAVNLRALLDALQRSVLSQQAPGDAT